MILCHSPLQTLVPNYADKYVLVSGIGSILEICRAYGFKKAIHVDEVFAMCPELVPNDIGQTS